MSATELRIVLVVLGAVVLAAIYWYGRPARRDGAQARTDGERREPVLGDRSVPPEPHFSALTDEPWHREGGDVKLPPLRGSGLGEHDDREPSSSRVGQREVGQHERIVSLYVVAHEGYALHGPDLVVAAEKAGLVHGDLGIYHRLVDTKPELGPVFSMANMVRPGTFDLSQMDQFSTPGVVLFMTLPGPLSALDAWDTMLPSAQRFAELLGAHLLDEERTPLGRQRIAALRDELRAFDRKREQLQIRPDW
ncbi:MAG: cell division protein ZipA [Xanthomonadales bacterium]|nr:Cell division protein ZipA [Xanthomonadales bacterium]MCC6594597.1 cell division protein ZipA [Xanthomonadales bacterium]MCE7932837.1 cell division protein ZipA [Xanthomonadales bacterium PRO6]